ncbi:translocon at the outer envelope membrane of chloroplasts 12, DNA J protein C22 [Hibiscus trionum]|uniref:Translocon at the outer envelope membrane of chloroplasts 12, DNA J protein C22 n=1 Tax=Hibiscus trionum TaxID=183268 RepID=A0A9W7ICL8_HIBTR|nr:translocon at the outer envelope membrane of chloroplasts 12, DNA J protein C22 [Hibiscus trionum]
MASAIGIMGGKGCSSWMQMKEKGKKKEKTANRVRVCCSSSSSVMDPYKTLRIQPGASESEVKKAFRQLALQYHPDVCRGSNCGVQFQTINEAYDVFMSQLRGETKAAEAYEEEIDDAMRGMEESDWDMWEEWMGWEGAGIRDYSSHINPYI